MAKGRQPPEQHIDHAAAFRDRLGRAAHAASPESVIRWDDLPPALQEQYRRVAQAVLDGITTVRRGLKGQLEVGSGYSLQRSEPYVEIVVSLSPMQCTAAKARELGLLLLECAEAAESDAAIMAFARETMGLDRPHAAQLLDLFRHEREKRQGRKVDAA